jgi:hypothetical protein
MVTKSPAPAKFATRRSPKAPAAKRATRTVKKTAKARKPVAAQRKPAPSATTARADSKQSLLVAALKATGGCTIAEMIALTGWQAHSVRGVISGVLRKKLGFNVVAKRADDGTRYQIVAA